MEVMNTLKMSAGDKKTREDVGLFERRIAGGSLRSKN